MGNTPSPADVGTPRAALLEDFLETLHQGRVPTLDPAVLLSEMGLDPSGLSPSPTGLATDTLLSQRQLMMGSLLNGSIKPAQRAQIQRDYSISDLHL